MKITLRDLIMLEDMLELVRLRQDFSCECQKVPVDDEVDLDQASTFIARARREYFNVAERT